MDLIYLNDFTASFHKYFDVQNIIYTNVHTLIYSYDQFLMNCYLHSNLKLVYDNISTSKKQTFNHIDFYYNIHFTMFDMALLQSKFTDFVEYMNTISSNKILFDKKIHIIIQNIHYLTKAQQNVLATLIDSQKTNSVICTSINHSKTIEKLKSRLFCKKIIIPDITELITKYAIDQGIHDTALIKSIVKQEKHLYSSLLHLHNGFHKNVIEYELSVIVNSIKKTKNIQIFISKIRECLYKLFIYNSPKQLLLHNIWNVLQKKYKKNELYIHIIVRELSVLDHNLLFAAKPIYHYEIFFLHLYKLVNSSEHLQ
jgi:hypothetical protein